MERVAEILRALLGRALSEHGPQAPALADVLIERAQERICPLSSACSSRTAIARGPR